MRALLPLSLALMLAGCANAEPQVDIEAEAAELMRLSREWSDVAGTGDLEATLAYWADDATMMPPGLPPVRGKEAMREYMKAGAALPGFTIKWEPLEAHVSPSGDMAYLFERNQVSFQDSTGATVTESNKSVTVWRKEADGSWKNVIDMWNADPTAWR
jgi:ketosteroid isomerase-like protein